MLMGDPPYWTTLHVQTCVHIGLIPQQNDPFSKFAADLEKMSAESGHLCSYCQSNLNNLHFVLQFYF